MKQLPLVKSEYLSDVGLVDTDFTLLINEDDNQISKWGFQRHSAFEWLAFITEELGELAEAISEYRFRDGDPNQIVTEATQVATLALKIAVMAKRQFLDVPGSMIYHH